MNENIKAGAEIHAGDFGYSIGNREDHETFVKARNQSLRDSKIRKLLEEVGGLAQDEDGKELTPALVGSSIDEFAKLLIQECANIAQEQGNNAEYSFTAIRAKWFRLGAIKSSTMIKRNFGIE